MWRPKNTLTFSLVSQTHLTNVQSTIQNGSYDVISLELPPDEVIPVQTGDVIGVYFPGKNPIPWRSNACYESAEQLRYVYKPQLDGDETTLLIGRELEFETAPLALQPCRTYMLQCRVGM